MKNLVEVKNIKKNYGKNEAVKGISFNIKEDEILGLLGPNGSGKTTTIGMLLGLLKPTSGEIFINGQKLEGKIPKINKFAKKVDFLRGRFFDDFLDGQKIEKRRHGTHRVISSPGPGLHWGPIGGTINQQPMN